MNFEWDEAKAKLNKQKHGITFEEAATVYEDENRIDQFDAVHSENEERMIVIGYSSSVRLLMVVTTERHEAIRIISARRANKREAQRYYAQR